MGTATSVSTRKRGATFDGTHHGAVPCPLLGVREVGLGIQVGGDEEAPRVLVDAQLGKLDLVVVDVLVEAHHHCSHLRQGDPRVQGQQLEVDVQRYWEGLERCSLPGVSRIQMQKCTGQTRT